MDETSVTTVTGESRSGALPRRPLDWLKVFGPGAIIASLTIGTGELIFSSRGGAIFGYRILFLFIVISLLKWGLVVASSRHMVLTGVHPYRRMLDLPGPRGWLPMVLLLIATVCLPIWVSFHSGVLGNLTAWMTGTSEMLGGDIDYLWGAAILALVVTITALRGYSTLERIQLIIVTAMVVSAGVTLVLYNPDWLGLLKGAVVPQPYAYPPWLSAEYPLIAAQPVWVETTRYVGVIGGAGFDYLAYTSFMRDKAWGQAGAGPASPERLAQIAADPTHPVRRWARAPLVDCSISFLLIIAFSAVFVASAGRLRHRYTSVAAAAVRRRSFSDHDRDALRHDGDRVQYRRRNGARVQSQVRRQARCAHQACNNHLVRCRCMRNLAVIVCLSVHRRRGQAAPAAGNPDPRQPLHRGAVMWVALPGEPVDGPKISSQSIAAADMVMVVESGFRFRFYRPGDQRLLGP